MNFAKRHTERQSINDSFVRKLLVKLPLVLTLYSLRSYIYLKFLIFFMIDGQLQLDSVLVIFLLLHKWTKGKIWISQEKYNFKGNLYMDWITFSLVSFNVFFFYFLWLSRNGTPQFSIPTETLQATCHLLSPFPSHSPPECSLHPGTRATPPLSPA